MKKILFVNACVRTESRTLKLARAVLDALPGKCCEITLDNSDIRPMDKCTLEKRTALLDEGNYAHPMFSHAKTFADADTIVIAAPYWDLSFPALLKCYLEAVTVSGITFAYSPEGIPVSLCKATKLIYVTTSGGPIGDMNFGFDYVKAVASGFFGIRDIRFYSAENLDIDGVDADAVLKASIDAVKAERMNDND